MLNAQLAVLGQQVRQGAADGQALLKPQLEAIEQAIKDIPRQTAEHKKKAGRG